MHYTTAVITTEIYVIFYSGELSHELEMRTRRMSALDAWIMLPRNNVGW